MLITAAAAARHIAIIQKALSVFATLQLAVYQFPEQACVRDGQSFDYIIVGGGTAGCVIANRLVEDNQASVLLIEAGGIPEDETNIPNLMLFLKQTDVTWNYTVQESGLTRKYQRPLKDDMSLGRVLGGSSSVGYLLYNPGNRHDYNSWADTVNDPTWNWENVQPYLRKSQRLLDQQLASTENGELYGKRGKIGLTLSRYRLGEEFFPAFEQMGNKRVDSFNGNETIGIADQVFTLADGVRQSTAYTYLSPIKDHPKLHVLTNSAAKRIIFDANKNAVAVEVQTGGKRNIILKARREIILSAGIVNSPKILMLSGIGPKEHLNNHNINTIVDLPVGQNLQDHMSAVVIYNMTKMVTPFRPWNPNKYPAAVLVGFTSLNKTDDNPDYQTVNYVNFPLYLMMYCIFTYGYIDEVCNNMIKTDTNSVMLYSVINKQKFKSKGKILLKSCNFKDDPLIFPYYYTNEEDVDDHARAIEDFVKIAETDQFKKLGAQFKDPELDSCNKFEKYSRNYWKCYVKAMATSVHNYSGTCSMGSVVDARLRVFGVKRLRVADASVMPCPTAGGTLAATIMIAEKVSDMIKEDNNRFNRQPKSRFRRFKYFK